VSIFFETALCWSPGRPHFLVFLRFSFSFLQNQAGPASPGPVALWPSFFAFPVCFCVSNPPYVMWYLYVKQINMIHGQHRIIYYIGMSAICEHEPESRVTSHARKTGKHQQQTAKQQNSKTGGGGRGAHTRHTTPAHICRGRGAHLAHDGAWPRGRLLVYL
jgi:hypothetical protein